MSVEYWDECASDIIDIFEEITQTALSNAERAEALAEIGAEICGIVRFCRMDVETPEGQAALLEATERLALEAKAMSDQKRQRGTRP